MTYLEPVIFRGPVTFESDVISKGTLTTVNSECECDKPVEMPSVESLIKQVIFNDPATIINWKDGTKTIVKCQEGDIYDKHHGIALCFMKKMFNNTSKFNEVFQKYIPEEYLDSESEDDENIDICVNDFIKFLTGSSGAYPFFNN